MPIAVKLEKEGEFVGEIGASTGRIPIGKELIVAILTQVPPLIQVRLIANYRQINFSQPLTGESLDIPTAEGTVVAHKIQS